MGNTTYYQKRIHQAEDELSILKKKSFRLSLSRLVSFILGIALSILAFSYFSIWLSITILFVFLASFLWLVKIQVAVQKQLSRCEARLQVLANEINCITNGNNTYYNGEQLADSNHYYALDLDIIGQHSLYQRINRARSYHGLNILGKYLLSTPDVSTIQLRQEVIRELAEMPLWREDFQTNLFPLDTQLTDHKEKILQNALNIDISFIHHSLLKVLVHIVPYFWVLVVIIGFFNRGMAETISYPAIAILLLIYFRKAREIGHVQMALAKCADILEPFNQSLHDISLHQWKSKIIHQELDPITMSTDETGSFKALSELKSITDQLDYRLNLIVGILLNIFMLWDFRVLSKLDSWKAEHSDSLSRLFRLVGYFETWSGLAGWHFNHPDYTFAKVDDQYFHLDAKAVHHPLIPQGQSVGNDFTIHHDDHISIITGSNMAGKSTFLRTIGMNMILAYAGTSSACNHLTFSPAQIMTYMRIKDALEDNVSTFKAELNRVEKMLQLISDETPAFILIDEMLRGTNSQDKLKGSIAIVRKLLTQQTYAMIATHDIQLTEMEKSYPNLLKNYYFDIEFLENDLQFDYKIKKGICENFNASYLLKQIGIE